MRLPRSSALLIPALLAAGCNKPAPPLAATKPAEVIVDHPVTREVGEYEDFTGKTEPVMAVEIRAQVTGYLDTVHFKDGTDVPEGAPLFDIDPRTYAAVAEQAKAGVTQARAKFDRLTRDFDRFMKLGPAASKEEIDRVTGDRAEADAAVAVADANRKLAETNLGYTKITAKFAGRLSKRMVDPGNIVKANETLLTTLISVNPIYATFDVDERTLLRTRRLVREGKIVSARDTPVIVQVGLADEDGYSRSGAITFIDNKVDPTTGTLRVRVTLENPKTLLSPGLFVRIRFPVGKPLPRLLVPEQAVATDQGQKYVYVVNEKDEVVYRKVTPGQQDGAMRVILDGLTAADRVIVIGTQRVRPGVKVSPKQAEPPKTPVAPPAPPAPGGAM